MSEMYKEQLVGRCKDKKDTAIKFIMVFATVLSFCILFFIQFGIIIPIILIIVDLAVFRRMDIEFEYIYTNGDLDVDKIIHKEKRKRMLSVNVNDMEILAPLGAAELSNYKEGKVYDFTTHAEGANIYEMIVSKDGERKKILFEPEKEIVEGIWMLAPRKTIRK